MLLGFRPPAGQVALIEPQDPGRQGAGGLGPVTGVVDHGGGDVLTILGVAAADLPEGTEVVVSIFAAEALYRIRATAHWLSSEQLTVDPIHDVERIQRRRWSRHELNLDVTVTPLDGAREGDDGSAGASVGPPGVRGRTLDIGMGGLRIETESCLPPGVDLSVTLMLPDGAPLVARASVVAGDAHHGAFEYRLAFDGLDDFDTNNLAALLDPQSTAADIRRKAATGRSRGH